MRPWTFALLSLLLFYPVHPAISETTETTESSEATEETEEPAPLTFNERLGQATKLSLLGRFNQAMPIFEELIETNAKEEITYARYAQALLREGEVEEAIDLYQRFLEALAGDPQFADKVARANGQLEILEKRKAFAEEVENLKPWAEAEVFMGPEMILQTNLPQAHIEAIQPKIQEIMVKEKELFERVLGEPEGVPVTMNLFIIASADDFWRILQERQTPNIDQIRFHQGSTYFASDFTLLVFFDGVVDWYSLAVTMARHYLLTLYYEELPMTLEVGLAHYAAMKLNAAETRGVTDSTLAYLNWYADQGGMDRALDVFDRAYEVGKTAEVLKVFRDVDSLVQFENKNQSFITLAWTLIHFFVEAGEPYFSEFFKTYHKYVQENPHIDILTSEEYFLEKLPEEKQVELTHAWATHALALKAETL